MAAAVGVEGHVPAEAGEGSPLGRVGLVAAGVIAGGVLAGTLSASASTGSSSTTTSVIAAVSPSSTTATGEGRSAGVGHPARGTAAHEALETAVTSSNATQAQAAAVKAVGSGTGGAVTTDVSRNGYEFDCDEE